MLIDREYRKILKKNTVYLKHYDKVILNPEEFLSKLIPIINSANYFRVGDCQFTGKQNPAYSYWDIYLNERYEITIPAFKIKKERKKFWDEGFKELSLNIQIIDKYTRFSVDFWSYKLKKPLENLLNRRYEKFKSGINNLY